MCARISSAGGHWEERRAAFVGAIGSTRVRFRIRRESRCPVPSPGSALSRSAVRAGVSVAAIESVGMDDEEQSAPTQNGRLLSRKSERVRHARYVRELASQTT